MLSFIIDLIIKLLNFILSFILTLVFSVFPSFDFSSFGEVYSAFFDILGNGLNLVYFVCGPATFIFGDIIIILFTLKHFILPIVNFVRKFAIK